MIHTLTIIRFLFPFLLLLAFFCLYKKPYRCMQSFMWRMVVFGNYSADMLIPSSSKESEYDVVGRVSVFLCGFYNRMKFHECVGTEV